MELREAASLIYRNGVPPTPQYAWPLLADRTGCAEVYVKHENHTPTGAFKVRGGIVYIDWLLTSTHRNDDVVKGGGIISATRGNHGQSIAFAAKRKKIPVKIVVPRGNSVEKNAAMKAFGADLITFGNDFDEARLEAERLAEKEGLWMVPSFHKQLVKGVATYALELFEAVQDIHTVYVPIGLGSGICGLIQTRNLLGLQHKTKIVGVVTEQLPAYALSFERGQVVTTENATTIADGMAVRIPVQEALDCILGDKEHGGGADRIVRVSDDHIVDAIRAYYTDTHNLAEGAGASALAALMKEQDQMKDKRVAVILCGGNIDLEWFHQRVF